MSKISVRLPEATLLRVRMRALQDGTTIQDLGREFFERYANGGLGAAGETNQTEPTGPVRSASAAPRPSGDLVAGGEKAKGSTEEVRTSSSDPSGSGTETSAPPATRSLRPHNADPKDKASQEHAPKTKTQAKGLCPHRVPLGSFCKRCEEATA